MSDKPAWRHDIGRGWHPILDRLHEQLIRLVPCYVIEDVKEKWGGLRIYLDNTGALDLSTHEQVLDLLDEAEDESFRTCEFCGTPGEPRSETPHSWIKTVCDSCWNAGSRPARLDDR